MYGHRRGGTKWRFLGSLTLASALWLALTGIASAHAHLVQADPAPNSVISRAPSVALFLFDEPLNPALTRVRITDASGHSVTANTGSLAPGHHGELWQLPLPSLPAGTYSMIWTAQSATDGHITGSFYTFRIASTGSNPSLGSTGTSSGGAGNTTPLDGGAIIAALVHWISLLAQALWLGALAVELLILAPLRRGVRTPAARLAHAATPRLWQIVRAALVVVVWALAAEVIVLAVQSTNGDWARALTTGTFRGIFSSQNGHVVLARFALLLAALVVAGRAPTAIVVETVQPAPARRPREALGIVAGRPAMTLPWEVFRDISVVIATSYMILVAFSGHAADVSPGWLSYSVDWLHLVATAVWAGGIAALAIGVLPLRHALPPHERAPAVLTVLDRFSPLAYSAVGILALSGLYNAVSHINQPSMLSGTLYGQLLIAKVVLIALLMALSASHVYLLRPRLMRLATGPDSQSASAIAAVHEGLATLAGRLRVETGVGAAILLATALMSQTLPAATPAAEAGSATATPPSITDTAVTGDLRAELTVAPPAVGTATFTLRLRERGQVLTGDTAAAIIHLASESQPALRATLTPEAHGSRFTVRGGLAADGTWRADVAVRTAIVNSYRTLHFEFTVGPDAAFLASTGGSPSIDITPGRLASANTITIKGVQASAVRILSQSLDMAMGIIPYTATPLGHGAWRVTGVYPLMQGRWAITVQERRGAEWVSLRQFVYQVPPSGPMHLLSGQAAATPARPQQARVSPAAVRWAGLPYRAVVSFVNNGLVYVPGQPTLVRIGQLNHSVARAPDGKTVWVTDYMGSRIAVVNPRQGRIVASIPVGIGPVHIVFSPDGRRAYVTDFLSNDVTVIDVAARRALTRIPVGLHPHALAITPDGRQLWVPCSSNGGMWVIDTRTNKVTTAVPAGLFPHAAIVSPDGRTVYMTDASGGSLVVVDRASGKVRKQIPVGTGSAMVVVRRDGRRVFVSGQSGHVVTVIDTATLGIVARIPVGSGPHGMVFTPDQRLLYVAVNNAQQVAVVDTASNRIVARVDTPGQADELALVANR